MTGNPGFFADLNRLLQTTSQKEPAQQYSEAECDYDRLHNIFKYSQDPNAARCLFYLKFLKDLIRKRTKVQDDVPVEEIVCETLLKVLQIYFKNGVVCKSTFARLEASVLDKISLALDYIITNLPNDYFDASSKNDDLSNGPDLDPCEGVSKVDSFFYIPLKDDLPELDNILERKQESNNFTLLYKKEPKKKVQKVAYPLESMFECYKASIPTYTFEEFKQIVQSEVQSDRSDDELLGYFIETFGCAAFDFLSEIIKHRWKKIDYGFVNYGPASSSTSRRPPQTIAGQVTVQSEKESQLSKKIRKMEKKERGKYSTQEFRQVEAEYEIAKTQPLFKRAAPVVLNPEDYPHIHDQMTNNVVTTKYDGVSIAQPENAIKRITNDYAEFTIPGGKKGDIKDMKLVQVSSLDSTGQLVFRDIKELNRIQSEVFPAAYNSNENLLVCAPTGSGKTNIALLTIVHQIRSHMSGNVIRKDDFKIVYVCPMKALATEMVANFGKKLAPIGISVKECTGDMQLTRKEIAETQMLVTTPEKWDVITRKGAVDTEVVGLLKLLILDEVHLLNGNRGPVIEALVARTLRQVVSSQSMIRIVALSATLPGYLDVANFLKVNPRTGLFFFDNRYRSVPLTTSFIGVKKKNENELMDLVCYEKVVDFIRNGHQAMVFVTSRNATAAVAKKLIELAQERGTLASFLPEKSVHAMKGGFKSGDLSFVVPQGFGIHHAGMVRSDRLEVERLFRVGHLKVVVCTTTLAWGVNLPAHAVIIRGTLHYDATKSSFVDMDMLDVMQIFGRAGRPQYDTSGHGLIITSMPNMSKYMALMTSQVPIESQFLSCVPDNLNAEIVLGTVSNLKEAMEWLSNTFLFCRIKKNPLVYGLSFNEIMDPEQFNNFLQMQLDYASKTLEKSQLIRFDSTLGELRPTNFGRIASFYYISHRTMELFHEKFHKNILECDILKLLSEAAEFEQIQVRMDELPELDRLRECNEFNITLDFTHVVAKVQMLIQANISRAQIRVSSLASDSQYIIQTVQRLARALFEIAKDRNYALQVSRTLQLAQMLEQQLWDDLHPLMQFKEMVSHLTTHRGMDVANRSLEDLKELSEGDLESLLRSRHVASRVKHYCDAFPTVEVDVTPKPITDGIIKIRLLIYPKFKWDVQVHGNVQHYYAWVEDPSHDSIYHMESFVITKRHCISDEPIDLSFTVPLTKPLSLEYIVKVVNSQYLHSQTVQVINLEEMKLFTGDSLQTKILDVLPLPIHLLQNKAFEGLYPFSHFNAVQSQVFHSCYHTDTPIILGAPTGSGKTIVAELCILRLFTLQPKLKVVYIAPMKALVRERVLDWSEKFAKIKKNVVEVTGDVTPRSEFIRSAHIIITTPEKWDAMSRNYTEKDFVKEVGLMVIDEIHLLGEDRGPVLEVIVSRMNYINEKTKRKVRIVGLSTAMANAGDLAYWLNADKRGIFNFSSAVRPVPLEIHIQGFDVKNYCPRMAAMNKSVYQAIGQYAPENSALIFVSSRKQTRITGYELMKFLSADVNPQKWMHCNVVELETIKESVMDQDLSHLLSYGIGMHHAGLIENDRKIVEQLYVTQKIQVLVATATLAWGVNFPARLVIVKGTEYFDGASKRYVDMPPTDVIQMVGRAGRPQFDSVGYACVFVQEVKKNFYRKFLFEPFPVESNLLEVLNDHVNAEVANGNITTKAQLLVFLQSTFLYRRLLANPSYYQMDSYNDVDEYLSDLADSVVNTLQTHYCMEVQDKAELKHFYEATFLGQLGSQYYLSYKTVFFLCENMEEHSSIDELLSLICQAEEYALFPVRHNEDNINKDLARHLGIKSNFQFDSPCLKVMLMIKCYLLGVALPNQDYAIDLKNVLDQIIRIIHAMMSLSASRSWEDCTTKLIYFCQMLIQGLLITENNFMMLPGINRQKYDLLLQQFTPSILPHSKQLTIPLLRSAIKNKDLGRKVQLGLEKVLGNAIGADAWKVLNDLPMLTIKSSLRNIETNQVIRQTIEQQKKFISCTVNCGENTILLLDIHREGSSNMNVYSKRFNKQKEEFWFLVLALNEELLVFKKFSFARSLKKVEVPIRFPQELGTYNYKLLIFSDCYIGMDQLIHYRVKVDG